MRTITNTISYNNNINLLWGITDENRLVFLYCGAGKLSENEVNKLISEEYAYEYSPVEIKANGLNCPPVERYAGTMAHQSLSELLKYKKHTITENNDSTTIEFILEEPVRSIEVKLLYIVYPCEQAMKCFTKITNNGEESIGIEEITSFSYCGLCDNQVMPYNKQLAINVLHNGWQKELQWKRYSPEDLGMALSQPGRCTNSSKVIAINNIGNWSSKNYIPCIYIEKLIANEYIGLQVENNGSWNMQIGEHQGHLYIKAGGPTETYGAWYKTLNSGESFTTVPVGVAVSNISVSDAVANMNAYRRRTRRENADNQKLPVIFNDYMNCLFGDSTTEKELPLIEAASESGCEVFCIDAGWYDDGPWWDGVGEWMPSEKRYPGGLKKLLDKIRDKGMIPGLWLEIEVVGINSPLFKRVPKEWFFMRHGSPVQEKSRYQLDFRNPEVREYASGVLKRLVEDYGVGYIKMDYNIDAGIGTDYMVESPGIGLLEHGRAYLEWLKGIFEKYPDLIIENCSSGGLRMDYAMLSQCSIQSTSDMEDYKTYSTITVNAPLAVCPEQAAVWSYPLFDGDEEETIYNMVNAIPLRIHQSGHLAKLSDERSALVKEGISYYKQVRDDRVNGVPFWPLGFSDYEKEWVALGITGYEKTYLYVWRRSSDASSEKLYLPQFKGKDIDIRISYPTADKYQEKCSYAWNREDAYLTVDFSEQYMARIFEIII